MPSFDSLYPLSLFQLKNLTLKSAQEPQLLLSRQGGTRPFLAAGAGGGRGEGGRGRGQGEGKTNRDQRFRSALSNKKENKQFSPGHRDIRSPEPQNKPGHRKKGAEVTTGFNPHLKVKGNGRQKPPSFHEE